jgi:YjbE family integral membrane protein
MLQTVIDHVMQAPFWSAVGQLVLINIVLSGDNAVVIALACRALARPQRRWGLLIGSGLAVVLRIGFAAVIAGLLQLPYLKIIGGVALIYIAAKLLQPDDADTDEVEAAAHLWRAVRIIVVADLVMSFDNILAITEIAKDNYPLLVVGLVISIPLVLAGAALVTAVLDAVPLLVWAGSALLGWVAGQTIIEDQAIPATVMHLFNEKVFGYGGLAAGAAGMTVTLIVGAVWRLCRAKRQRVTR